MRIRGPVINGLQLKAAATSFAAGVAQGALIAALNDPFAGLGLGTTAYATYGTVPGQLALTSGTVVAGASAAVASTTYSMGVMATSGDGKRRVGETLGFLAIAAAVPQPTVSITQFGAVPEGNSGPTAVSATATLNRDGSTASYAYTWAVTGAGSNPANAADFGGTFPSGSGTFAPGETSKVLAFSISGDTDVEPNEDYIVTITVTGVGTATSAGTITNDDTASPSSMSLQRTTAPAGASRGYNVTNLYGVPAGAAPAIGANSANYVIAGSEAHGWEIVPSATPAEAGTHTLVITAAGTSPLLVDITVTAYTPAPITWLDPGAVAIYSMVKVGSYSGSYVTLRRESDNEERSFGVAADNIIDRLAIDVWRGASDARVKQLWDTSGAGYHAVQLDPAKQPLWTSFDIWTGKMPCIQFDRYVSPANSLMSLEATAPAGWNVRKFSAVFGLSSYGGGRWFRGRSAADAALFTLAPTSSGMIIGTNSITTVPVPRNNPSAMAITMSDQSAGSGLRQLYVNGTETVVASPSVATAIDGKLVIGDAVDGGFLGDFYFFALYPTTDKLNTAINPMLAGMRNTFQFASNYVRRLVLGGDSIEFGHGVLYNRNRIREMFRQGLMSLDTEVINLAVPGQTVPTAASIGWAKTYRADVPTLYTSNIGQNSIGSTAAAQDNTYGQLTTMISNMNATGGKSLIFGTVFNRTSGDGYSQWGARQRQNNAGAFGILDMTQIPTTGVAGLASNTTYSHDTIHPTALTNAINARPMAKAINAAFAGETGLLVYKHAMNYSGIPNSAAVGAPASGGVTGSNGVGPYAWTIYSGALPTGITLNSSTGQLQGTFTTAGTYTFIIRQTDATGRTVNSVQLQIVVS